MSTFAGLVVFLGLLLVAVQLLVNLHAAAALTNAAGDAAREVASGKVAHDDSAAVAAAQARAEARARRTLGRYGDTVEFHWRVGRDAVRLRVRAAAPRFLLAALAGPVAFDVVDRTVTVRVEDLR